MRRRLTSGRLISRFLRHFLVDTKGAAAAELMLWATILIVPGLTVVDIGIYIVKMMQVQTASTQGVQAARKACGFQAAPVTDANNCVQATLNSAIAAGVQATSLSTTVSVQSGYPQEQYYCVNSSGALTAVGTAGTSGSPPTRPADCSSVVPGSASAPADYLKVGVTYAYTPTFPGLSLAAALPTPITATSWLRFQ